MQPLIQVGKDTAVGGAIVSVPHGTPQSRPQLQQSDSQLAPRRTKLFPVRSIAQTKERKGGFLKEITRQRFTQSAKGENKGMSCVWEVGWEVSSNER